MCHSQELGKLTVSPLYLMSLDTSAEAVPAMITGLFLPWEFFGRSENIVFLYLKAWENSILQYNYFGQVINFSFLCLNIINAYLD